jgi:luciferase family oxidoreductase group 1
MGRVARASALPCGVADATPLLTLAGVPLGVLDLAPVPDGSTVGAALRATIDLAKRTEDLGFSRFWVAEHHGMPGVASSSPPVLIGHIADVTRTIRVGSGGVMLPNHSSLVVAEQFGMLEALHPGRIDLGIGRAPGTDQATAQALRHGGPDDFPRQLTDLLGFFTGQWPEKHPYQKVHAIPGEGNVPDLWLLGSSGYSAQVAGTLGIPFAFAHHFMPQNTLPALDLYRESFRPSAALEKPYSMIAAGVVCADTDEHARFLAGASALSFLKLRSGRPGRVPTPEEAAAYPYSPMEQAFIEDRQSTQHIGAPNTVIEGLTQLIKQTGVDELMITTQTHDPADRQHSFDLVAAAARALGGLGLHGLDLTSLRCASSGVPPAPGYLADDRQASEVARDQGTAADADIHGDAALLRPVHVLQVKQQRELVHDQR